VKAVLEEFVPDAAEAIEIVRGRVVLVDGTLAPCWSYANTTDLSSSGSDAPVTWRFVLAWR
jgi:hypothetical protein